ncbi:helix-turn-helix domain-containing protein [Aeromonas sp. MdU4]|uniref:helix-turn-helix domain-containing protein n=1 Tax=Aeromonas sp. MdU4 TaxID=3342819 RepID=UPI0035BAADBB
MKKRDIRFKFEEWGIACHSGNVKPMERIHSHCEIELNWLTNGSIKYQFSNIEVEFSSNNLYIFNGIRPHQLTEVSTGTQLNWITIPSWHVFNWGLDEKFLTHLANCDILVDENYKECLRDRFRFERWSEDIAESNVKSLNILLLEIRCRLERLLLKQGNYTVINENLTKKKQFSPPKKATTLVTVMQGYILKNLSKKISIDELAAFVGLNPSYATTLFRKEVGQSPVEFIVSKRIEYVKFLLVTTSKPILEIAMDAGFGSSSRFYDAFTAAVKIPPVEYRNTHSKHHI